MTQIDVSKSTHGTKATRQAEGGLSRVLQTVVEGVIVVNLDGIITYANKSARSMLRCEGEEIVGKSYATAVCKHVDADGKPQPIESIPIIIALKEEREIKGAEHGIQLPSGDIIWVSVNALPMFNKQGELSGAVASLRDVTEREQTAALMSQQLQESQTLYNISQMLAGAIDLPATLQHIADAAASLITSANLTILHLLDDSGDYLQPVAVAGGGQARKESRLNFKWGEGIAGKVLATGTTINVSDVFTDQRYVHAQGTRSLFRSLMVAPVRTGENSLGTLSIQSPEPGVFTPEDVRLLTTLGIQAAVAIEKAKLYHDLHTSLEYEKTARAQLVQAEKLAAVGRIVASVAHELNNPLQAIQNALYLINLEESLSEQAKEDLKTVLNEADRMSGLIARLREIYRPNIGDEFQPESMNILVQEVQSLLGTHLRHNNVNFDFRPTEDLPPIPIIRDQIKQVILNISLNAVEAMPDGGTLTVTTLVVPSPEGVLFKIADTGPSIDPKILPYIFDPFVTTKDGGTGLGLAITYDIVQQHSGRINVESEPVKGTVFEVWLPLKQKVKRMQTDHLLGPYRSGIRRLDRSSGK